MIEIVNIKPVRNILVPVDLSQASIEAAHLAASLAQVHDAKLFVLQIMRHAPCSVLAVRTSQGKEKV